MDTDFYTDDSTEAMQREEAAYWDQQDAAESFAAYIEACAAEEAAERGEGEYDGWDDPSADSRW
jgi:hypothetical protein